MRFASIRDACLPAALVAVLTFAAVAGWELYDKTSERRTIAELRAGRNVAPGRGAGPEVLFARAYFLLARDRIDEAQALGRPIAETGGPALAARFHYDLGNARMKRAIASLEASRIDPAIPEVRLAKEAYRLSLSADPELWDARYNMDVAMRLVRDFPELERGEEETQGPKPKTLWTDLPGLPRGLP